MREMSVTEFFREFGGGTLGNVRWHFKKLAEHGWLRKVRTEKKGPGRPRHIYRATEFAFYDQIWAAQIPASVRAAFTARIMQQLGDRVACALQAGTLDSRGDRFISLPRVTLDERGWSKASEALTACFRHLAEEQTDAKVRLPHSRESPILMMVVLAGFESPPAWRHLRRRLPQTGQMPRMEMDTRTPLGTRLAKVLGDPISLTIVNHLNQGPMSPSELRTKIDVPVWQIDRKCKHLEKFGWVARVDEKTGGTRRGATEVFYRATWPPVDLDLWPEIPEAAAGGAGWERLCEFYEMVAEAIRAGTLDASHDRHLTWTELLLDDLGWRQVITNLVGCERSLAQLQQQAIGRLADSQRDGLSATCFLAGFEVPPKERQDE